MSTALCSEQLRKLGARLAPKYLDEPDELRELINVLPKIIAVVEAAEQAIPQEHLEEALDDLARPLVAGGPMAERFTKSDRAPLESKA